MIRHPSTFPAITDDFSNSSLGTLLQSLSDGFCIFDSAWRCIHIDERVGNIISLPPIPHVGEHVWTLFPSLRGSEFEQHLRLVASDKVTRRASLSVSPERPHPVEVRLHPYNNGVLVCFLRLSPKESTSPPEDARVESRMRLVLDSVPAFLSYVDRDVRYQVISKHYEGYFKHTREEIIGRPMREIIGERGWAQLEPVMAQALNGEVATFQAELDVPGLGRRWSRGTYTPVFGEHGEVQGVTVLVNDITDEKRYEEALQEKELYYRSVFESPGVANAEVDIATGRLLKVNRSMCEMLGYSEDELVDGRTCLDITHPDDRERNRHVIAPLLRGEVDHIKIEKRYIRRDGREIWGSVAVTTLRGLKTQPDKMLAVIHDITARVAAEQALRQSEERVRLAVQAAGIGYWTQDAVSGRATLNETCASMLNVGTEASEEEVFSRIIDEDRERVRAAFYESFLGKHPYHAEFRVHAADGSIRWLIGLGDVVRDASGKLLQLYGVNLDITERKRFEEVLAETARQKDEFLATLAHELRNPLAPISNALQVWPKIEKDPAQMEKIRSMMERQVQQLKHLIDDLLDVSRISKGKIRLRRESVELSSVLESAIESVRPFIEACGHTLLVDVPKADIILDGDRGRLTQILGNLLNNAAKYSEGGGVITLSVRIIGDVVEISVRDKGAGISSEMISRIFDPFVQVERTVGRSQGGLGIGLTLVKKLVELHDGTIEAKSAGLGEGSEFIVRLPARRAAQAGEPPTSQRAGYEQLHPLNPPSRRVLVVDDLHASADTLSMMLEALGQDVQIAYDGVTALAKIETFHPDVVLSDIAMPGLDGYALARQIQTLQVPPPTLIALTGYGQEHDRKRTREVGFSHHLVKPTSSETLREILKHLDVKSSDTTARPS